MDSLWYQSRRDKQFKIGEKLVELQAIKDELLPLMREQDDRLSINAGKGKEAGMLQKAILFIEGGSIPPPHSKFFLSSSV